MCEQISNKNSLKCISYGEILLGSSRQFFSKYIYSTLICANVKQIKFLTFLLNVNQFSYVWTDKELARSLILKGVKYLGHPPVSWHSWHSHYLSQRTFYVIIHPLATLVLPDLIGQDGTLQHCFCVTFTIRSAIL